MERARAPRICTGQVRGYRGRASASTYSSARGNVSCVRGDRRLDPITPRLSTVGSALFIYWKLQSNYWKPRIIVGGPRVYFWAAGRWSESPPGPPCLSLPFGGEGGGPEFTSRTACRSEPCTFPDCRERVRPENGSYANLDDERYRLEPFYSRIKEHQLDCG